MRKAILSLTALLLAGLLFQGLAGAAEGLQSIAVQFRNISVLVNGQEARSDAEPFIYGGRTYVPLRLVAEALGTNVEWDPTQNRVVVTGKVYVSHASVVATRDNFGFTRIKFTGAVINRTNQPALDVSVTCAAFNPQGVSTANGATELEGPLAPGSSATFEFTQVDIAQREKNLTPQCIATYRTSE